MNGQRASINWAGDYLLPGAIAQLGERLTGSQEVGGSNPPGSTQPRPVGMSLVRANEFRRRFGWFMERSAAGEEFLVTRRGKPYVRLLPARDQLAPAPAPATAPRSRQRAISPASAPRRSSRPVPANSAESVD